MNPWSTSFGLVLFKSNAACFLSSYKPKLSISPDDQEIYSVFELQCYCKGTLGVQVSLDLSFVSSQMQVILCGAPQLH